MRFFCAFLCIITLLCLSTPARAIMLIRDAETEAMLSDYMAPILEAADMPQDSVKLYIVNDERLNAFVSGGSNIFLHTGLLMESDSPAMIKGVLAHELGHITGGHLVRMSSKMTDASLGQVVSMVLAGVAAAAGSPEAGSAIMTAGAQMSMANFFAFTRAQEQAADQAAITYMSHANMPLQGMLDTLELLRSRERLRPNGGVPYLRSHPLTKDRISHVRHATMHQSPHPEITNQEQARFDRVRAKLRGFLLPPSMVEKLYLEEPESFAAHYAKAVSHHRRSELDEAIDTLQALAKDHSEDAYLHELMGQIWFEHGKITQAREAYEKADQYLPNQPMIEIHLAQTLLMEEKSGEYPRIQQLLEHVLQEEPQNLKAWDLIARLWQEMDRPGLLALARAEQAYLRQMYQRTQHYATEARERLPKESSAYQRAGDLLAFAKHARNEKDEKDTVPMRGFSL